MKGDFDTAIRSAQTTAPGDLLRRIKASCDLILRDAAAMAPGPQRERMERFAKAEHAYADARLRELPTPAPGPAAGA